jgi:uncharacterized protein YdhG (YjbR/CyaY superfamily)
MLSEDLDYDRKPPDCGCYIAKFAPDTADILEGIRTTGRSVAPDATEKMSYKMPTFFHGVVLIHYAAFKGHAGHE